LRQAWQHCFPHQYSSAAQVLAFQSLIQSGQHFLIVEGRLPRNLGTNFDLLDIVFAMLIYAQNVY
jgi:hypothetical protein